MTHRQIQTMAVVFLLATCGSTAWAASLNVKGNVNVQGDGSGSSPGNLSVNSTLTVSGTSSLTGNLTVGGTSTMTGNLTANGGLQVPKYFCSYTSTITASATTNTVTMGSWDVCYLSNMFLSGMDDSSSDSAQCKVNPPANGLQTGRPTWTMTVVTGSSKIDKLQCTATCWSFSTTRTGESC